MPLTSAPRRNSTSIPDSHKLLVERLASSSYLSKSARLRDMLLYLCERVLEHGADVIHEHEVGHKVFGRSPDYDTNADNIVRVHVSTLRKRIEQYFANEGADEPVVIEIPKGNYAPVFRKRPVSPPLVPLPERFPPAPARNWKLPILVVLSAVLACCTLALVWRIRALTRAEALPSDPVVRQLWSEILAGDKPADIVLDDATLGMFQELTGQRVTLSEYFDRSYVRSVEQNAINTPLGRDFAETLVLKRQSSYAGASLLWKMAQMAASLHRSPKLHFARDYSFRELKADNVVLLGNSRSNPWIEPFESRMTVEWKFDRASGSYYPVDRSGSLADENKFHAGQDGESREGYATISLLPNLSGTGKVLIISGTGGAAVGSALDFLSDGRSLAQLRSLLPPGKSAFPYFEALLRVKSRNTLPRDTTIVICRPPKS